MLKELEPFKKYLSIREIEVAFDAVCGKPVMWGHNITNTMTEEEFRDLKSLNCVSVEAINSFPVQWIVVTKKLTREEAIKKYGKITNEEFGTRGGWESITFGGKIKFISKVLKP